MPLRNTKTVVVFFFRIFSYLDSLAISNHFIQSCNITNHFKRLLWKSNCLLQDAGTMSLSILVVSGSEK